MKNEQDESWKQLSITSRWRLVFLLTVAQELPHLVGFIDSTV